MEVVAVADLEDPNPDVGELFRHYNKLYFRGALDGFAVQWGSPRTTSSTGACGFGKAGNVITLSEPLLKFRSTADVKNTLLHEMIHAVLFVKEKKRDHNAHGPSFRAWMDSINSCSLIDHQRPSDGYNITTHHDFRQEVTRISGFHWKCESCGDLVVRAMNRGPPTNGCIENVGDDKICGNLLCHWHNHRMSCGGNYTRMTKPPESSGQKRVPKGTQKHLGATSKRSKSHGATQDHQESHSAGLQEKAIIKKPNAVSKLLSLVAGSSGKSLGSSSSKKEAKQPKREAVLLNTTSNSAAPPRKQKQANLAASKKQDRSYKTKKSSACKEYGVASAWLSYYASEESDEPVEPLRNKRTESRRREKILRYSRARKRGASSSYLSDSRCNALVPCDNVGTRAPRYRSPENRRQPRAPCLDIVVADTADHSTPLLQSSGPSDLVLLDPIAEPVIIFISDDDS